MSNLFIFFSSFIIAFSGAMMPGSLLIIVTAETLHSSNNAAPSIITGHAVIELALLTLLFFGMGSFLLMSVPSAIVFISGGLILIILALKTYKAKFDLHLVQSANLKPDTSKLRLILLGIFGSISNPYWLIWWLTIGAGYVRIAIENQGYPGIISFFLGHITADYLWYLFVGLTVQKGKSIIKSKQIEVITHICSGILLIFAAIFLFKGSSVLFKLFK